MLEYEVIWGILYMGLKLDWSLSRGWKVKTLLAAPQPYRAEITNQITPEIPTWKFFVAKIFHHRPSSCKLSSDVISTVVHPQLEAVSYEDFCRRSRRV